MSSDPHLAELLNSVPEVTDDWRKGWADCLAHQRTWGDAHRVEIPQTNPLAACILVLYGVVIGIALLALVQWAVNG